VSDFVTTAEVEKEQAQPLSTAPPAVPVRPASADKHYGWPSRLRSYLIFDPLIWAYTLVL
jgi:hypothetical protein